ncbi:hypothetical protein [Altererythrobacter lutimaris]|uniref:Uncharacterized protein n=1 Tax=Altererythrobacter lutimaris TaxID=2743979 RepID=A0A850H6K9_9SPHN|nr:hypothetical protein [Altererythrobacter lutimaris]NVE94884.1 hypothetical protein [Altererythrobacter lutimaris]
MAPEEKRIITAVLAQLKDGQSEYEKFAEEYPEEDGILGRIADHRFCVAREVAGAPGELDRPEELNPDIAPNPSIVGERWEKSKTRTPIPAATLPAHLRWNGPLSFCPSGVIRLGTPEISGDTARVFIENDCSGWCGWGGEVLLKRIDQQWRVTENVNWWEA